MSKGKDVAQKKKTDVENKNEKTKQKVTTETKQRKKENITNNNISRETKTTKLMSHKFMQLIVILVFFVILFASLNIFKYLNIKEVDKLNIGIVKTANDSEEYKNITLDLMSQRRPRYNFTLYNSKDFAEKEFNEKKITLYIYNYEGKTVLNKKDNNVFKNIKSIEENRSFMNSKNFNLNEKAFSNITQKVVTKQKYINYNGEEEIKKETILDLAEMNQLQRVKIFIYLTLPILLLVFVLSNLNTLFEDKKELVKEIKEDKSKININKEVKKEAKVAVNKTETKKNESIQKELKEDKTKTSIKNEVKIETKKTESKKNESKKTDNKKTTTAKNNKVKNEDKGKK